MFILFTTLSIFNCFFACLSRPPSPQKADFPYFPLFPFTDFI